MASYNELIGLSGPVSRFRDLVFEGRKTSYGVVKWLCNGDLTSYDEARQQLVRLLELNENNAREVRDLIRQMDLIAGHPPIGPAERVAPHYGPGFPGRPH